MADYTPRLNENTLPVNLMPQQPAAAPPAEEIQVVPARVVRAAQEPSESQEAPEGAPVEQDAPEGSQAAQEEGPGVSMTYRQENGEHLIYVDGPSLTAVTSWEAKQAAYAMRVKLGMPEAGIDLRHHAHILQPGEEPESTFQNPSGMVARLVYRLSGAPHGAAGTPILGAV